AQLVEAKMAASIPDGTAELVWQAAESLYTLASCLREGEDSFGPMADAARALHLVADRFPVRMRVLRCSLPLLGVHRKCSRSAGEPRALVTRDGAGRGRAPWD